MFVSLVSLMAMEDNRSVRYRFHAGKAVALVLMFDASVGRPRVFTPWGTDQERANLHPHWPGSAEDTCVSLTVAIRR